ncbi:MAG: baseplate J/gp47 family protein, partial [Streptosporangiaceae bacterium]
MTELTQQDGNPVIDYQARDYQSLLQAMRQLIPQKMPEWLDYANEADLGNVLLELFAQMGDILSYYQDRVANESFLGTAQSRRSVIQHLRLIGYQLGTAAPAAASLNLTVPGTVTDTVTVNQGDAFATKSSKTQPSLRFEYTSPTPLVINFGSITADPGTGKKTVGIGVEEGRLFQAEPIGTGNGSADQRYPLAHPGLILRPPGSAVPAADVLLTTTFGAAVQAWTLRDTLAFSQGGQYDFAVEIDENDQATVVFGDGNFGAAPASGAQIAATYRTGGGAAGNVPAGVIATIIGAPQLALLGAAITNPAAATGGADRESIAHAVQQAPAVFRSLRRAVTADDYEALALSFQGVGKVRAVPGGWNQVSLLVAPAGGGKVSDVLEA